MQLTEIKIIDFVPGIFDDNLYTIEITKKSATAQVSDSFLTGNSNEKKVTPQFVTQYLNKSIKLPLQLSYVSEIVVNEDVGEEKFEFNKDGSCVVAGTFCGETYSDEQDDTLYEIDCGIKLYIHIEVPDLFSQVEVGDTIEVSGELQINIKDYYELKPLK